MPRLLVTESVRAQNRECQRKSRARKRELVDDLKKQVEDYQRRGVQATRAMQEVARRVDEENLRLRRLLLLRGVSEEDIAQYLAEPDGPSGSVVPGVHGGQPELETTRSQRSCATQDERTAIEAGDGEDYDAYDLPRETSSLAFETSCDLAAAILVELCYHADAGQARAALGCSGAGSCSVKNTDMFRLMDPAI